MIKFKYCKVKNIFAVGNTESVINYENGLNLVLGENFEELDPDGNPQSNGSGKSLHTVDAFLLGLFGKTLRDVKKVGIVNKYNKKNGYVEIAYDIDNVHTFVVQRGISPNFLKVIHNGTEYEFSEMKKTQAYIEQYIGTFDDFVNLVVFNINKYKSFFTRSAKEKRNTLEQLLNIRNYGKVHEDKKKIYNLVKRELDELEISVKNKEEINENIKKENENIKKQIKIFENDKEKEINDKEKEINILSEELQEKQEKLHSILGDITYSKLLEEHNKDRQNLEELIDIRGKFDIAIAENTSKADTLSSINVEELENNKENIVESLTKEIDDYNEKAELKIVIEHKEEEIEKMTKLYNKKDKEHSSKVSEKNSIKRTLNKLQGETDICPTCGQKVDISHIQKEIDKLSTQINEINNDINEYEKELTKNKEIIDYKKNEVKTIKKEYDKIHDIKLHISKLEENIKEIEHSIEQSKKADDFREKSKKLKNKRIKLINDIDKLKSKINNNQQLIDNASNINNEVDKNNTQIFHEKKLLKEIKTKQCPHSLRDLLIIEYDNLEDKRKEHDRQKLIRDSFSETGIRQSLVAGFLDLINTRLNYYLDKMSSSGITVKFDESFKETFKIRSLEYEYGNFSSGQQKRVDLAFILTSYDIINKTGLINTNVVFFDEILDSSLDKNGMNKFIEVLNDELHNKAVYLISHRAELQSSKYINNVYMVSLNVFSNIRKLEKNKNI